MSYITNDDNIYAVGSAITAKENPALRLVIVKYHHRIYYCEIASDTTHKHLVYFERELIAPGR